MNEYVVVYTIGPVQSFIANARKTEDLWSGSYLLSYLIEVGLEIVLNEDETDIVFPSITKDEINMNKSPQNDVAAHPNRFTFIFKGTEENLQLLMDKIDANIKQSVHDLSNFSLENEFSTEQNLDHITVYAKEQINTLLEIYWAASQISDGKFNEAKSNAEKEIGALKNYREFRQEEMFGLPCTVCQDRSALSNKTFQKEENIASLRKSYAETWGNLKKREKKNEFLCAVCLMKRHMRTFFRKKHPKSSVFERFPSTVDIGPKSTDYFAILQMDGDNMGSHFSNVSKDDYSNISRKLAFFSKNLVPKIIRKFNGKLIYSGGDDVLAFLPVHTALMAAHDLRIAFSSESVLGMGATLSAGLAIGHKRSPLRFLLEEARRLEGKAKSYEIETAEHTHLKNALSICLVPRSGEKIETIIPWNVENSQFVPLISEVSNCLYYDLSDSFIYQLYDTFKPLLDNDLSYVHEDIFKTEFIRLMNNSIKPQKSALSKQTIEQLLKLYKLQQSTLEFIYLLKILTFLNRKERVIS